MSSSSKKQAKAKRPALEEAYIETSIKAQANTIDADPGSEAQHGQNSTGAERLALDSQASLTNWHNQACRASC